MLDSACERDRVGSGGVVCDCDRDWAEAERRDACWAAIRSRETGGRGAMAVKVTDGYPYLFFFETADTPLFKNFQSRNSLSPTKDP